MSNSITVEWPLDDIIRLQSEVERLRAELKEKDDQYHELHETIKRASDMSAVNPSKPVEELTRKELENEAAHFAARTCPHFHGDEWGNARCREIDSLREQAKQLQEEIDHMKQFNGEQRDERARNIALTEEITVLREQAKAAEEGAYHMLRDILRDFKKVYDDLQRSPASASCHDAFRDQLDQWKEIFKTTKAAVLEKYKQPGNILL
jgi:predicted RNase H-like nuclease (RuvC/YqgF family)